MDTAGHMLKKIKGGSLPTVTVALATEIAFDQSALRSGKSGLTCGEVVLEVGRWRAGRTATWEKWQGRPWGCKLRLWQLARPGQSVWVFGKDIYRQLVAIDFFGQIDGRRFVFKTVAAEPQNGTGNRKRRQRSGFLCQESGCTILVVHRPDGGTIHFVDVDNYHCASSVGAGDTAELRAMSVTGWIIAYRNWLERIEAGGWKYTLGSQAMYLFRKRFMTDAIVCHKAADVEQFEDGSLFGGRAECYRLGKIRGPVYHYDARSLYGFLASTSPVPVALVRLSEGLPAMSPPAGYGLIADVSLNLDKPLAPWRDTKKGIVIWPTGKFRTVLCGPELQLVVENATEVHRVAWYRLEPALSSWAAFCWQERQWAEREGPDEMRPSLKVFSQLLYGKFAQRLRGWKTVKDEPPPSPWSHWFTWDRKLQRALQWRSVAGRVEMYEEGGFVENANVAIAAWITSLARAWLWKVKELAGHENVYYVDTDSLFVNADGNANLTVKHGLVGECLGGLRCEGIYEELEIRGIKDYSVDGRVVCSGWAYGDTPVMDVEPITQAAIKGRPPQGMTPHKVGRRGEVYKHGLLMADGRIVPKHFS